MEANFHGMASSTSRVERVTQKNDLQNHIQVLLGLDQPENLEEILFPGSRRDALKQGSTILVGPNSQGVLAPGVCKIGVMATGNAQHGHIGIISRSASLTSEATAQLSAVGLGQSTTVGKAS